MARDTQTQTGQPNSRTRAKALSRTAADEFFADEIDDRAADIEIDDEPQFLRGQKRVAVRRGAVPAQTAQRIKYAVLILVLAGAAAEAGYSLYSYATHSWRFLIASRDHIEITGLHDVARHQILETLGGDIGRNIFFISLTDHKRQIEEIPWVESATIMRFLPDHLRILVRERIPVAFVRIGSRIAYVDRSGVVMDIPSHSHLQRSFPVITGLAETDPPSTRAGRMKIYMNLLRDLDAEGARYSQDLSEVDLTDPDDLKITGAGPQNSVLVHLGDSNFLQRYKIYIAHLEEWRQQFPNLASVDLRYEHQIIVNPDAGVVPATNQNKNLKGGTEPRAKSHPSSTAPQGRRKAPPVARARPDTSHP